MTRYARYILDMTSREMLSKTDCMKINSLYGCFKDPAVNRKIQIICAMVGI